MSGEESVSNEAEIAEEAEIADEVTESELDETPSAAENEINAVEVGTAQDQPADVAGELEQARTEAAEHYDRYLRTAAELENFRKRTAKVRVDTREDTLRDLLISLAPVLDNMNRALAQETPDADGLRQGFELIQGQLARVFESYGLKEIGAVGQPFDPNLHDAMMEIDRDDCEPGMVVEETEKGYTLNKKVVRPSRVIVSKSSE
jgi:molecular chaperone GrpE